MSTLTREKRRRAAAPEQLPQDAERRELHASEEEPRRAVRVLIASPDEAAGCTVLHDTRGHILSPAEYRDLNRSVREFYRRMPARAIARHNAEAAGYWQRQAEDEERRRRDEEQRRWDEAVRRAQEARAAAEVGR
jgi:hypothetical protein